MTKGQQTNLFGESLDPPPTNSRTGRFVEVAIEQAVDRVLDYAVPDRCPDPTIGQRVRVPLGRGNKPHYAYVVAVKDRTQVRTVKPMLGIADDRVMIPPDLMQLARWMSRYYVAPLGVVLDTIVPAAVKKHTGLTYLQMVQSTLGTGDLQEKFESIRGPKLKAVIGRLLQIAPGESVELQRLASEAGTRPATVRKLEGAGIVVIRRIANLNALGVRSAGPATPDEPPAAIPEPDDWQIRALEQLLPSMRESAFGVNLLHGVTGSGKTEVYLRCIDAVVRAGKQAVVLVPEIALTPQTVRRFTARFSRVAVLHSGLTASDRHRFWHQIVSGNADVIVGARSAVFAPVTRLGVIVVDEEHEPSYKQDTSPRYHGRDVAVMRGHIAGCPVILGSATPSLESYARATTPDGLPQITQPYRLISLPNRVRGLPMPKVEVVDMKQEARQRKGINLLSVRLETMLRLTLAAGHQAILLLNRRGYSSFVYCSSCGEVVQCKYCDATMTYHRTSGVHVEHPTTAQGAHTGQLHCHYCLAVNPLPSTCPACGKKISLFGLGTQRMEEELRRKMPELTFARVDSDTMRSSRDYENTLTRFGRGEIQVLLGTQMIAKGLDFPNVALVGVVSGDTALSLPDFRASERTFQLITQVAGRAGRGDTPGRVILQTFVPGDPAIVASSKHDYLNFASAELANRREVGLPPFARMARIVIRDESEDKAREHGEKLLGLLTGSQDPDAAEVSIRGPMPCAVGRIAGYHRIQIVLLARTSPPLQRLLAAVRSQGGLSRGERIAVDVDPVSLL